MTGNKVQVVTRSWIVPDLNDRDDLVTQSAKEEFGPPDTSSVTAFQQSLDSFFVLLRTRLDEAGIRTIGWRKRRQWIDLEKAARRWPG